MTEDLFTYLKNTSYPGRGILMGRSGDGRHGVIAYFIMGRSENSRNRVFEKTPDGIRTRAYDEARMTDPALIIYHPVRFLPGGRTVVSNGDHTDVLRTVLQGGGTFSDGMQTQTYEPDAPNWTPRIAGLLDEDGSYSLAIVQAADGCPACTARSIFTYESPFAGTGHFLSTYTDDGTPLPSFARLPVFTEIPQKSAQQLAEDLWQVLDQDNRVSLYTAWVGLSSGNAEEYIINTHEEGTTNG